jgi:sugar lactone lactonase YvrE
MTSYFAGLAGRAGWPFLCIAVLLCSLLAQPTLPARSASLDTIADYVLGQPNFDSTTPNTGASGLHEPWSVAVDRSSDRLYVADMQNSRVLSWPSAVTRANGQPADIVIGQLDFTSNLPNQSAMTAQPRADTLYWPTSVALDGDGNLYVADSGNGRVLVYTAPITTSMAASRVFGQPNLTTRLAPAAAADRFTLPIAATVDSRGNLYVADYNSYRVLEFDAALTGDTTADRVFGQPNFTSAGQPVPLLNSNTLNKPAGLAVDAAGNLYVAEEGDNRVVEYDAPLLKDTNADRVFGQPDFFTSTPNTGGISAASMNRPAGVTFDSVGRLYVADAGNDRVLVYDMPLFSDTSADYIFGSANGGTDLRWTMGVALDSQDNLYIADSRNRVLIYDQPLPDLRPMIGDLNPIDVAAGGRTFILTVRGWGFGIDPVVRWNGTDRQTLGSGHDRLIAQINPADIATIGTASIAVATFGAGVSATRTITIYDPLPLDTVADAVLGQPGFQSATINYGGTQAGSLQMPFGIAIQPGGERVFVADTYNNRVLSWPNATTFINGQAADLVLGQPSFTKNAACPAVASASILCWPTGLAIDDAGHLYVVDTLNNRILVYDTPLSNGMAATHVFGQPNFTSNTINTGGVSASSLNRPLGVAVDAAGDLYIADNNNRVLKYTAPLNSDAVADQVFGQPDFASNTPNNGGISASTLSRPAGITLDSASNLYIADFFNHRVLRYDTLSGDTLADQVFGQPNFAGNTPNTGGVGASTLNLPYGVASDRFDNLYIVDYGNHRVLEYREPLLGNSAADRAFGQANMTNNTANSGGLGRSSLYYPEGIAIDASGNIYVSDAANHRVLRYNTPLVDALPAITTLAPSSAIAGGPAFTLHVTGTGFLHGTVVRWGASARPTTVVSETLLAVQIGAGDIAAAGAVSVTVALPDGGESSAAIFTISNPLPAIDQLNRSEAVVGSGAFTLTISGTQFVAGSVAQWGGVARPTTVVSSTQLAVAISAADLANVGLVSVTVLNPAPGGGVSNAHTFTINNPLPTIDSLSRTEASASEAGFTLTITGTNFIATSIVRWNGADRPTTFVSGTRLMAQISAAEIASAGPVAVTVFNSTPGGGLSNALAFTIKPNYAVYMPLVAR